MFDNQLLSLPMHPMSSNIICKVQSLPTILFQLCATTNPPLLPSTPTTIAAMSSHDIEQSTQYIDCLIEYVDVALQESWDFEQYPFYWQNDTANEFPVYTK